MLQAAVSLRAPAPFCSPQAAGSWQQQRTQRRLVAVRAEQQVGVAAGGGGRCHGGGRCGGVPGRVGARFCRRTQVCPNCTEPYVLFVTGCRCGRSTASAATPTRMEPGYLDIAACMRGCGTQHATCLHIPHCTHSPSMPRRLPQCSLFTCTGRIALQCWAQRASPADPC